MANTTDQQIDSAVPSVPAQVPVPAGTPRRDLTNAALKSLLSDIVAVEQALAQAIQALNTAISGRAPSDHSHAMANVTGLVSALQNKVETSVLTPITATKAEPVDLDTIPLRNSQNGNAPVWVTKAALLAGVTAQLSQQQQAIEALQQGGGGGGATAPSAFVAGAWTLTASGATGTATLNITALPTNGGSAITALQYRIGTGAAVALAGTGTGSRSITGLIDGAATDIQIRAVNAIGSGAWSDVKSVTTSASGGGGATVQWSSVASSNEADPQQLNATGINPAHPAGASGTGLLVAVLDHVGQAAATAGISPPAGWTLVASVFNQAGFTGLGGALGSQVYVAPGNTPAGAWTGTLPPGGEGYCAPRFAIHFVDGASSVRAFQTINETTFGLGDAAMPGPSVVAAVGDMVMSHLYLAQVEDAAISAPAADYTRVVEALTPNRRSTVVRNNAPAGATGTIAHGLAGGAWTARVGITLALRSA